MHGVSIELPVKPADLYIIVAATGYGMALYEFFYWDPINKCRVETFKKFQRYEQIQQGPLVERNQKEFFHSYCEGSLDLVRLLPGFKSEGEYTIGNQPTMGNMIFMARRMTWENGYYFDMPRSFPGLYVNTGYTLSTSYTMGTSGSVDHYTNNSQRTHYASLSFSGKFDISKDLSKPTCSITMTGKVLAPGQFYKYPHPPIYQVARTAAVVKQLARIDAKDYKNVLHSGLSEVKFGKIPNPIVPSNLTDRIYSELVIPQVNNLENLMSAKEIKTFIPKLRKIIARHNLKSVAELYLIWKYEYSTTMMDIEAYWHYIQQVIKQGNRTTKMIHLSASSGNVTTHYTISLLSYTASLLETFGLSINSANIWDTLPLSFIVDWFVGIGDILQRLHEENVLATIPVRYCTTSTSSTNMVILQQGPFKGATVKQSVYNRTVSKCFPTPDVDVVFKNPIRHFFDGSALVVASRRH